MGASGTDALSRVTAALEDQGFKEDINNTADGVGSGRRGYVLGSIACIVEFQAVESYGSDELEPGHPISGLQNITVSCGRLN